MADSSALLTNWSSEAFDRELRDRVEAYCSESSDSRLGAPSNLKECMLYSLLGSGKRIRPRLCLASSRLIGLSAEAAVHTATALEMYHCSTLIHDDLPCLDNDDFRRGRPSNHKVFGEGLALVAGDALLTLTYESFSENGKSCAPQAFYRGLRRLLTATGLRGVMGGQAEEMILSRESPLSAIVQMHRKKTGILFEAALLLPLDLHGIAPESEEYQALTHYAEGLGLAFQLADDREDLAQDQNRGADAINLLTSVDGQKNVEPAYERLRLATERVRLLFGKDSTTELANVAQEILDRMK